MTGKGSDEILDQRGGCCSSAVAVSVTPMTSRLSCCKPDSTMPAFKSSCNETKTTTCCNDGCDDSRSSDDIMESNDVVDSNCCGDTCQDAKPAKSDCNTNDYKCTEDCIKVAAAVECALACVEDKRKCCSEEDQVDKSKDAITIEPSRGLSCSKEHEIVSRKHSHDDHGCHQDEPCDTHLTAAMDKYAAYLKSARCICLSVLKKAAAVDHCRGKSPTSATSHSTSSEHCSNAKDGKFATLRRRGSPSKTVCCEKKSSDNDDEISQLQVRAVPTNPKDSVDVEKGKSLSYVLMNVEGMTCSGCVTNLTRALSSNPAVANVEVSFINGTASFDLDTKLERLDEVIRKAQRSTGFKLNAFSMDTHNLDVILSIDEAKRFQSKLPLGVEQCELISKLTYQVSYNPNMIGARDLLSLTGGQLSPPRADRFQDEGKRQFWRVAIMLATATALTIPVVVLAWSEHARVSERTTLIISLVLATFVQAIAVPEFYRPALASLIYNKVVEMDMLVVISITAAYGYSVVASGLLFAGTQLEIKPFFETSTLLITLILLGRLLAVWARKRAVNAVSLRSLQASTAVLVTQEGHAKEIDARLLQFGDIIEIQPHSQVVTDAEVLSGASEVDESMLTGESIPVLKTIGSSVVSGTINGSGKLKARVSRLPGKNTITDIANLVEQAQGAKPRVQGLADKVAGYFVPVVVTISIIVFIVWITVCLKIRHSTIDSAIGTAIGYAIAVLAVSCPCALGLAVPMVLVVAGGVAARGGVIIKTGDVIERGFKVTDVIFDKTGTLTQPNLEVTEQVIVNSCCVDRTTILSLTLSLVKGNKHPVSLAINDTLEKRQLSPAEVLDIKSIPGHGIHGIWNGKEVRAGNPRWLDVKDHPQVMEYATKALTIFCVTLNGELLAIFGLKSRLRSGAAAVVRELQTRNISVHIVSGDVHQAVQVVARDLGIQLQNVASGKTPAEKQEYVRKLMDENKTTLFCGDGTNDAVAIAQAHVGVQVESSSDVTRATADVILLQNLEGIVSLLDVSRAAFHRIIFNFVWSAVYNVLAILLAGGAFVKVRIPPAYAGLGEIVSVMPVIIAALTMPKLKPRTN